VDKRRQPGTVESRPHNFLMGKGSDKILVSFDRELNLLQMRPETKILDELRKILKIKNFKNRTFYPINANLLSITFFFVNSKIFLLSSFIAYFMLYPTIPNLFQKL